MAVTIGKLIVSVGGAEYTGTVTNNATSIPVAYSAKGKSVTATGYELAEGSDEFAAEVTITAASAIVAPTAQAVNVSISDGTTTKTVALTITLSAGEGESELLNFAGWFKFRRIPMKLAYTASQGGVVLRDISKPMVTPIKEVLGVQSEKVVAYTFDPKTQKLKLCSTNAAEVSTGNVELVLLVLEA